MVALDNFSGGNGRLKINLGPLVGGIAFVAVLIVVGALVARGFSDNGFRLASLLAWRYTAVIFFLALFAGPACRIAARVIARACPAALSRKLVWGFCASYGVYLVSVFLPNAIRLSAGATVMVIFGGGVVAAMAATVAPLPGQDGKPRIGEVTRRMMLGIAALYFWATYTLMALSRLTSGDRPDAFYGISLALMVAIPLVRLADRITARRAAEQPHPGAAH